MYDGASARFFNVDPKATDYYFQSPYVYAANGPIKFIDENGEGPILAIFGAIGGAIFEMGSQVVSGMSSGRSFIDAVCEVDYADVGIAAIEYGAAGLTNGVSLAVSRNISNALQSSIDVNYKGEVSTVIGGFNGGKRKSIVQVGSEFVIGKVGGNLSSKTGKAINKNVNNAAKEFNYFNF